ncbi:MAG: hypothetical protein JJV98_02170 [Desulfosarcina sp.]|nr:hypothetical protein [Desulfobacterales bacterium]
MPMSVDFSRRLDPILNDIADGRVELIRREQHIVDYLATLRFDPDIMTPIIEAGA